MSKNTKDVLIIVGISLLVILAIAGFLIYKNNGKEEVVPASGNSISNDNVETQENVLTETEQENIEKETEEKEEEKTEEKEKEESVNKKPINTNKDMATNTNKDTATNINKDTNSSNNQNSTSGETTNTAKQLSKPENIKWSQTEIGLVTWAPVQYANGYFVEIFKDGTSIGMGGGIQTDCDIKELIKRHGAGTYTVTIQAESDILPASDKATTTYTAKKLSKPENIKWSQSEVGVVTWSPVQHANGYFVEIFKDGTSIGMGGGVQTDCDIKELIKRHGAGTYTVTIQAESDILPASDKATTTYTV